MRQVSKGPKSKILLRDKDKKRNCLYRKKSSLSDVCSAPTSCCLRRKNSSRTQLLLLCRIFSRRLLQRRRKMTSNSNLRSTSSSAILNGLYLESEVSAGVSASLASTYTRSKRSSDSASNSDHALVASVASVNQP